MANKKAISPYTRLLSEARKILWSNYYRSTKPMFTVDTSDNGTYKLNDVNERVKAAEQLGYEVILKSDGHTLKILYREKIKKPEYPFTY